jgi:DNA-binding YbaB/EbfC family protein
MNIQKMMQQAQKMQQKITDLQSELEKREVEGAAGGGMVKLTLSGKGALVKISLDDSLLEKSEKEMLEDLIVAAHNDAKKKAEDMFSDEMGKVASGMGLPAGMKLPF